MTLELLGAKIRNFMIAQVHDWRPAWCKAINAFAESEKIVVDRKIGVYLGKRRLKFKDSGFEIF